ncbi:MAG: hypothetical protein ABI672_09440 [Vicinamibacteria bacterium]
MTNPGGKPVSKCTECKRDFVSAEALCGNCGTRRANGRAWFAVEGPAKAADQARVRVVLDHAFNDLQRDGHVEIGLVFTDKKKWVVEDARTYPDPTPNPGITDSGLDARFRVIEVLCAAGIEAE